ncbi:MAG TPA: zf-HC2 domain-containing protein [Gemmatimonadales bacterium]|nr:zf-HC2 domain-containing protein [Gemmatimonadales bacterium]
MRDQWTDQLSDYVDEELADAERRALDAHLTGCVSCRVLLEELRRVRANARVLPDQAPDRDLWPGIARAIAPGRSARRALAFSVPQLLAAGVALILVSGGAAWIAARRPIQARATAGPAGAPTWGSSPVWRSEAPYAAAIAQLEAALDEGRKSGTLDSATVLALVHSLATIDTAILDARHALAADPASAYLNHHLADTMRRKLDLLRQATAIATPRT